MKKNKILLLIMILLISLLMVVFVACNKTNNVTPGEDPGEDEHGDTPTVTTFTVSFDTDGSSIDYPSQTVPYGGTATNPNGGDVSKNPYKPGYEFRYWGYLVSGNYTQWSFATNTVTSSITLKAIYGAKSYVHTLDLNNTDPNCSCTQETYESTFGQAGTMPVPTCRNALGEATDQFLYWYYLDSGNKEVRFSYWVSYVQQTASSSYSYNTTYYTRNGVMYSVPAEGPTSVADFSKPDIKYYVQSTLQEANTYNLDKTLTLKAKWYSQLPDTVIEDDPLSAHTVTFISNGGTDVAPVVVKYSSTLAEPTAPTKDGYEFDGWYLGEESSTGTIEYEGKKYVMKDTTFDFDMGIGDASFDTVKKDTVLIAKWTKKTVINNASDWHDLITSINEATEDQRAEVEEILSGTIIINNDISLNSSSYALISSKIAPFSGKIDGQWDDNGELKNRKITISLPNYIPTASKVALFEEFSGLAKHIDIVAEISLDSLDTNDATIFEGLSNKGFYFATFAAKTTGAIFQDVNVNANITVTDTAVNSYADYSITIGGLVAYADSTEFTATWNANGSIIVEDGTNKGLTVGMLAGTANKCSISQGYISQGDAEDGITIQVSSSGIVYAGGLIGKADSSSLNTIHLVFSESKYDSGKVVNLTATSTKDVYAGGFIGHSRYTAINSSSLVGTTSVRNTITGTSSQSAFVGGLVGLNEGTIVNSFAREFNVLSTAADKAYAGGIAGSCVNSSTTVNCGKIENSYAATFTAEDASQIDSVKAKATTAEGKAYAGGLTGNSKGCYISKCFAFVSTSVDVSAGGDYMLGYITAIRDASSTVTTCYTDSTSGYGDTLNLYPRVAMRVTDTQGTYTYNFQDDNDHLDINKLTTNGATSVTYTQFRSGRFVYENMGWPNGTWKLYDTVEGVNVYSTTIPELRN